MLKDGVLTVGKPEGLSRFELNESGVFLDGKQLAGVTDVVIRASIGLLDEVEITMKVDSAVYSGTAEIAE